MLKVDQTKFHNRDLNLRGNCLSACVASILEKSIDSVIDFQNCTNSSEQIKALDDWLKPLGLVVDIESKGSEFNNYRIACGLSSRGRHHAVVYFNEELAHDPHPSREVC